MTPENQETKFTASRLWAAALEEHEQSWTRKYKYSKLNLNDRSFHDLCKGELHPGDAGKILKEFFTEYGIARTLPACKRVEFFEQIKQVTKRLDETTILNRMSALKKITDDSDHWKFNSKPANPVSAASKISWFINPTDWTMFDSYAVRAIEKLNKNSQVVALKFPTFYSRIDCLKVPTLIQRADDLIQADADVKSAKLHGSRVFDKLLWIMGSHDYYKSVSRPFDEKYLNFGAGMIEKNNCTFHSHLNERWGVPIQ